MTAFMVALPASPQVRGVEVAGIEPGRWRGDLSRQGADLRRRGDRSDPAWSLRVCSLTPSTRAGCPTPWSSVGAGLTEAGTHSGGGSVQGLWPCIDDVRAS